MPPHADAAHQRRRTATEDVGGDGGGEWTIWKMQTKSNLYVAELAIPSALFTKSDERGRIPQPNAFGIVRGYWQPRLQRDHLGTNHSTGLTLTMEFVDRDREAAEDKALAVGLRLSAITSMYSGSPLSKPRLTRLARIGPNGGVLEQNEYFYLPDTLRLPRIKLDSLEFNRLLDWFGKVTSIDAYRLDLAARWYGVAVGASDPLDGYLATWIGLESIGPVVDKVFHPSGPKAVCTVCQNKVARDRDRGRAGIEHTAHIAAQKLLDTYSVEQLEKIRNQIAHGLAEMGSLRSVADKLLPDLLSVLGVATLTAARPEKDKPGLGKAARPRDYEFRPDARASLRSSVELLNHRPFFDEWIPVTRSYVKEGSRIEPDGLYVWGAQKTELTWTPTVNQPVPALVDEYIAFERLGHEFTVPETEASEPPPTPREPWRTRPE